MVDGCWIWLKPEQASPGRWGNTEILRSANTAGVLEVRRKMAAKSALGRGAVKI
jgi:hypothetical protein